MITVDFEIEELLALLRVLDLGTCHIKRCDPTSSLDQTDINEVVLLTKIQMKLQAVRDKKIFPPATHHPG